MSEPDFNIETVDAGDIGYNHLNLQAELTELDDIYDGALLFFEWGESDSLEEGETELAKVIMSDEDGNFEGSVTGEQFTADEGKWVDLDYYNIKMPVEVTDTDDDELYNEGPEDDYEFDYVNGRIKVLEDGDMEDGTDYEVDYDYGYGNVIIDELSENTEYHYKAIAESIAYDSEASMENIFENERNTEAIFNAINTEFVMEGIKDSENTMDVITDSEIAMDQGMADVMPRTTMLLSPHIIDTMWSKEIASESFWNRWDVTLEDSSVSQELVTWLTGGYALQFTGGDDGTESDNYAELDFDLTDVSTLKVTTRLTEGGHNNRSMRIKIDGVVIWETDSTHNEIERDFDLSEYTGVKTITLHMHSNESEMDCRFGNLYFE